MVGFKRRAYVCAIFVALGFLNANTFAQEEKETLNQRLDRLEKQNEELSKALKEHLSSTPSVLQTKMLITCCVKIQQKLQLRMCLPFLLWVLIRP